ncbi:MAG: DUF5916 domain-containing protein [Gemmatimonadaceae bacterium]
MRTSTAANQAAVRLPSIVTCMVQWSVALLLCLLSSRIISAQVAGLASSASVGRAVRVERAPILDGRDDDEAWQRAVVMDQFRQFEPTEDAEPSLRTAVRVVYDDRNVYVLVRSFDPRPDSIISLLARRDVKTTSDQVKVFIDAYHDRRTGVEVGVNAAGVKRDASIYQDATEDLSWDGVWDVSTGIDSLGWVAEFRIPFSQLRFSAGTEHTFGFTVVRDIARRNERVSWPLYRNSRQGIASQLGTLEGISGIERSSRLELLPYVSAQNATELRGEEWTHPQRISGGLDLKYGITDNFTVDATINPDFGQVEADPAVLNLTAFEIRFEERRPFFQEGVGMYKCQPCQGLFYSRRIGRSPQLAASERDPVASTIVGAAKLSGRVRNGLNVGLIEAVTQRESGISGRTIEPQTNYFVGRLVQELREGRSSFGALVTATNRTLDADTDPFLRRAAYAGSVELTHRFARDRYELTSYAAGSHVEGSAEAIALTQANPVHLYQRPDDDVAFDPTRTSLNGSVVSLILAKRVGVVRGQTWLRRASIGMELNDAGLVANVNDQQIRNDITIQSLRPRWFYRRSFNTINTENHWTTEGLPAGNSVQLHSSFEFMNAWGAAATYKVTNLGTAYCISCARGGPALRASPRQRLQLNLEGDTRRAMVPHAEAHGERADGGRSDTRGGSFSLDLRASSQFAMTLGANRERKIDDQQWIANSSGISSELAHFTFARLNQTTMSLTGRLSWTATPTLSLQLYGQPFVSSGGFAQWRELADGRAEAYDARFRPFRIDSVPSGFNVKQFNSNAVVRWEYRPGSTLFVVWQQGRSQRGLNPGTFEFVRDYRDLFSVHPNNTLLVKLSYWLNP